MHGFENGKVFEGCMPIEVMAARGEDTMRFGPLKPGRTSTSRGLIRNLMRLFSFARIMKRGHSTILLDSRLI